MRNTLENERYVLAYGIDHIEDNFIEVWDKMPGAVGEKKIEDERKTTVERIVEIAETYGFDLSHELDDGSGYEGSGCGGGCETCVRLGV